MIRTEEKTTGRWPKTVVPVPGRHPLAPIAFFLFILIAANAAVPSAAFRTTQRNPTSGQTQIIETQHKFLNDRNGDMSLIRENCADSSSRTCDRFASVHRERQVYDERIATKREPARLATSRRITEDRRQDRVEAREQRIDDRQMERREWVNSDRRSMERSEDRHLDAERTQVNERRSDRRSIDRLENRHVNNDRSRANERRVRDVRSFEEQRSAQTFPDRRFLERSADRRLNTERNRANEGRVIEQRRFDRKSAERLVDYRDNSDRRSVDERRIRDVRSFEERRSDETSRVRRSLQPSTDRRLNTDSNRADEGRVIQKHLSDRRSMERLEDRRRVHEQRIRDARSVEERRSGEASQTRKSVERFEDRRVVNRQVREDGLAEERRSDRRSEERLEDRRINTDRSRLKEQRFHEDQVIKERRLDQTSRGGIFRERMEDRRVNTDRSKVNERRDLDDRLINERRSDNRRSVKSRTDDRSITGAREHNRRLQDRDSNRVLAVLQTERKYDRRAERLNVRDVSRRVLPTRDVQERSSTDNVQNRLVDQANHNDRRVDSDQRSTERQVNTARVEDQRRLIAALNERRVADFNNNDERTRNADLSRFHQIRQIDEARKIQQNEDHLHNNKERVLTRKETDTNKENHVMDRRSSDGGRFDLSRRERDISGNERASNVQIVDSRVSEDTERQYVREQRSERKLSEGIDNVRNMDVRDRLPTGERRLSKNSEMVARHYVREIAIAPYLTTTYGKMTMSPVTGSEAYQINWQYVMNAALLVSLIVQMVKNRSDNGKWLFQMKDFISAGKQKAM